MSGGPPPSDGISLDCTACGACCVEGGVVDVWPEDDTPRRHTLSVRRRMGYFSDDHLLGLRTMRTEEPGTRCACLRGTLGSAVRCAIYARRPRVCRNYEPGSPGCLDARATMARKLRQIWMKPRGYDERQLDGPQPPGEPRWRMPDGKLAAST